MKSNKKPKYKEITIDRKLKKMIDDKNICENLKSYVLNYKELGKLINDKRVWDNLKKYG